MKTKVLYIISLIIIFCLLLGVGAYADESGAATANEAVPDTEISEADTAINGKETSQADTDITAAILEAIDEHSGEILSLLAFVGSIILALVYKLGLTPLVRGALSSMLNSLGVLKASVEASDSKCSGAVSVLEERIAATEGIVNRLDEAIAATTEAIKAEEANSGERADMRLIMQMQINMLYDIFMTSALPQYQKDAVGERISAMNKLLTARSNEESSDSSISEIGG